MNQVNNFVTLSIKTGILFLGLLINQFVEAKQNEAEDLKTLLGSVTSLQADFTQKLMNERGKFRQTLSGEVYLKRPGLLKWEVTKPEPRLVVADGKVVWNYDAELEQVTVKKINKDLGGTPLYFLTGEVEKLEKEFDIQELKPEMAKIKHCKPCYKLVPSDVDAPFQWMIIGFQDKVIQDLVLLDQLGQQSILSFSHIEINQTIDTSVFTFKPPKGVDVVEE